MAPTIITATKTPTACRPARTSANSGAAGATRARATRARRLLRTASRSSVERGSRNARLRLPDHRQEFDPLLVPSDVAIVQPGRHDLADLRSIEHGRPGDEAQLLEI